MTTIQKWGNSCAVRLPQEVLRRLDLRAGQEVEIREGDKGTLSIVPAPRGVEPLAKMLSRITKQNQHAAADWGEAVGREAW
jgi:antitoxin MazE